MKKLVVIIITLLTLSATAIAQPRAVGARFAAGGWMGSEFSYQHNLNDAETQFLEVDLGLERYDGFRLTGTWNWDIWHPVITASGDWILYLGAGTTVGFIDYDGEEHFGYMIGAVAQVGLEYRFESVPLSFSADIRPALAGCHGLYKYGTYGLLPNIGIRYYF